jgi:hypothetical protein
MPVSLITVKTPFHVITGDSVMLADTPDPARFDPG